MNGEQLDRTLGRIEQKIDDTRATIDIMRQDLRGEGGLESRLRSVESDMNVMKAASAMISGAISIIIAIALGWFSRK